MRTGEKNMTPNLSSQLPVAPIILCGGSGTRLWPLSRESYPKQFVNLGDGRTLFRDTLLRAASLENSLPPLIICNEKYRFYVKSELSACKCDAEIILEPEARNTAPAIALGAFALTEGGKDAIMLVMPSDHYMGDSALFCQIVDEAAPLAMAGRIVAFGIQPSSAATGFGYIRGGEKKGSACLVSEFIEKPDKDTAEQMFASGGYYWNAGIFLLKASVFLEELKKYSPAIYASCESAWANHARKKEFLWPGREDFLSSPEDSIDYAVMEHTDRAVVIPLATDWDDLGSWEAFFRHAEKDGKNNACSGDVMLDNVSNSYIRSSDRLVAAIGVSDLAVIETRDAVLVARREDVQKVKNIVGELKRQGSYKYKHHPLVYRPWGSYENLAEGERFRVKRIVVNPGEVLSLQMHHHRAEHWIVVSGTAEVTNGDTTELYTENQSTYIPLGRKHRVRNPGLIPLIMIEIQSGAYLGEDDIVRYEDVYGRNAE